jgi:hypothetical protein
VCRCPEHGHDGLRFDAADGFAKLGGELAAGSGVCHSTRVRNNWVQPSKLALAAPWTWPAFCYRPCTLVSLRAVAGLRAPGVSRRRGNRADGMGFQATRLARARARLELQEYRSFLANRLARSCVKVPNCKSRPAVWIGCECRSHTLFLLFSPDAHPDPRNENVAVSV